MLYADDLALHSESLESLKGKLKALAGALESKRLRVNVAKTKMMISSEKARKVRKEWKFPLAACRKVIGSGSILCQFCNCWIYKSYKRCSDDCNEIRTQDYLVHKQSLNQSGLMVECFFIN